MKNLKSFNGWVIGKLTSYLQAKEGFEVERTFYTNDGVITLVKDAFGVRYEIQVKTVGSNVDKVQFVMPAEEFLPNARRS